MHARSLPRLLALPLLLLVAHDPLQAAPTVAGRAIPFAESADATGQAIADEQGALQAGEALARAAVLLQLDGRMRHRAASQAAATLLARAPTEEREELTRLQARLASPFADASAQGVITALSLAGPFRDTGGGLDRAEGPESRGFLWDAQSDWSYGSIGVRPLALPAGFTSTLVGVPLDVFVHPRTESCSYLSSFVTLDAARELWVRVASAGAVRLFVDGKPVAESDELHRSASFDRLAVRVQAEAGVHSLAVKVCTGPLSDDGRVRLRLLDAKDQPLVLPASATPPPGLTSFAASRSKVETTPLQRALERGDDASRFALLTAAGADDAKSPRASGLAESLARSRDVRVLALVATLAPSQSLRSSIIEGARHDTRDPLAPLFTRRAIEAALAAELVDQAIAIAQGSGLAKRTDGEALWLGARIDDASGSEVFRLAARRRVLTAFQRAPGEAPHELVGWLLTHGMTADVVRLAGEELERRGLPGSYAVLTTGAETAPAKVVARAHSVFEGRAARADDLLNSARYLESHGLWREARPLVERLVRSLTPNRAEAFELFADLAKRDGNVNAAMPALARAASLSPGDARVRAELALHAKTAAESERNQRPWDERHLRPSAELLAKRSRSPQDDIAERQLYWLRAVELHDDGRVSQLMHYAREIGVAPRSDDELYENLPAEADLSELLRARVHKVDGKIAYPAEEHVETGDVRLKWPALERGDVVEVALRQWTERSVGGRKDPPFYFLDYAGGTETRPLIENHVVVAHPKNRPLHVSVVRPGAMQRKEHDEGQRHVIELGWDKLTNVADEPFSPPMSELVPLVVGSSFGSWSEFLTWYQEAVRRFAEPDAEIRRLAAELTRGKTTREAKLQALFEFVADKIRYVNFVSGEWWLPNRPQEVLARREGDCDDKAILLIALLASVDIHAEEVLVQTRLTSMPSVLQAPGVAAPLFDHGIAFLPGPNGGTYLDATSPGSRLGPLPAMDTRAMAVRVDAPAQRSGANSLDAPAQRSGANSLDAPAQRSGANSLDAPAQRGGVTRTAQPEVVQLPSAKPEDHGRNARYEVVLDRQGDARLEVAEQHSGDAAFWLRTQIQEAGAREPYVEQRLLGSLFPSGKVSGEVHFQPDIGQGKATVKYPATVFAFARRESDALVFRLAREQSLTTTYAPLKRRTLPMLLPADVAPSHDIRELRVQLPAGMEVVSLPRGGEVRSGPFGQARLQVSQKGRTLTLRRELSFDQHAISPADYPAFREFLSRIDALFHQSVRLEPTSAKERAR